MWFPRPSAPPLPQWHPDRHPEATKPEAEKRFKAISEAFQALSSPSGRSSYAGSSSSSSGAASQEWGNPQYGRQQWGAPPGGGGRPQWGYSRSAQQPSPALLPAAHMPACLPLRPAAPLCSIPSSVERA